MSKDVHKCYCDQCPQYKSLEAERDRLNDHLQKMQVTNGSLTDEVDRLKAKANKLADALRPLVRGFEAMRQDHHSKLVENQTFESACENWDKLIQEPMDFGPVIEALADFEKGK